ncbi:MAG: Mov34/MPN/PAD-1 family protein [Halobacteriales archaeon]|nr:Mov34/MPN/PAD-1 family protein [Halobacteriales archaeon]
MGLFGKRNKEPAPPPRRKVTKVSRNLLELIYQASRSQHPHEFAAGLRAEGDTLTEIVVVPTQSGRVSAHMQLWTLPIDRSVVGTVHSHPSGLPLPSDADKQLFRTFGHTHIIIGEPYAPGTWRSYDFDARPIPLDIV